MNDNQCCGTCRWHKQVYELDTNEYDCNNLKSEFCGDYTDYSHTCDYWEVR